MLISLNLIFHSILILITSAHAKRDRIKIGNVVMLFLTSACVRQCNIKIILHFCANAILSSSLTSLATDLFFYIFVVVSVALISGGLFDDTTADAENVFKYATQIMNNQRNKEDGQLQAMTKRIEYGNVFQASNSLCKLMSSGVMGILHAPLAANSALHVQNMCDSTEMPLLETRFDPYTEQPVINLHPHPYALANLYLDLVNAWGWESFTIVYEDAPW
jgi:hypothetical protein